MLFKTLEDKEEAAAVNSMNKQKSRAEEYRLEPKLKCGVLVLPGLFTSSLFSDENLI